MVIGDMVADVYLEGIISRISREAPVLVLEHGGENVVPGGAANAVHNAATLGGDAFAVGVVGEDAAGRELAAILAGKKVHTAGLIIDPARPTITKTRVMAGGLATVRQQIVRIDREAKDSLSPAVEARLLEYIGAHIETMAAVVISDYGSITLSPAVRDMVIAACRRRDIPCIVDSRYNILAFAGATVVKQNEAEVAAALGYKNLDAESALVEAGERMLAAMQAEALLLTRGPDGMSLFEAGGRVTHIPVSNVSEVFDVTGAGDTAVVTAALALAAGASYVEAARLANFAAGIVVKKPGTATTTTAELREAVGVYNENNR
ncbi:PfkB family carbohydrate kinase [Selenomonadales bacterium 4137-cl]|uniref:PfkB family carbohydrate kinase n=2 Tax=Anaeroselena agilis TaxID=3063788 RepID=A0ABU3P468_9FIRM|nr:PfkB family carbohydrate kinase [Selenomonadales bacterium 4137-cl]